MKVAITGGIGCGKSTVLKFLEAKGIACLSADNVVRRLLSEDNLIVETVIERFGTELRDKDGSLNRKALAKIVFQSKSHLDWLESLLHPLVQEACEAFFKIHNFQLAFIEMPLLFENVLKKIMI